ncbi:helix-turn-helix transcriptional regulator [Chitinophaga sp. RAB17]|uniref:helix-turn-helix transcriptional regulator n=1 Tax=Chitinophaga sp. RAB17 TaxID=3233049 RepID=UPI003F9074AC
MSIESYNRIKAALADRKKTGKELASHLGMSEQMVSKWVTNTSQPSLENLYNIAEYLKVSVCLFLASPDRYKED